MRSVEAWSMRRLYQPLVDHGAVVVGSGDAEVRAFTA
jgi:hypothetical protein